MSVINTQDNGSYYIPNIPTIRSGNAEDIQSKGLREATTKTLSTGHRLIVSPQEDKMLRRAFDYISGYKQRIRLEKLIDEKHRMIIALGMNSDRLLPLSNDPVKTAEQRQELAYILKQSLININAKSSNGEQTKEDIDAKIDEYFKLREELRTLQKKENDISDGNSNSVISIKDIDAITKKLGVHFNHRQLELMIWEVDEKLDNVIDWEEFQLAYYRNIVSDAVHEPKSFFRFMEFIIFDEMNKGYIIEDDCMEALFARLGSGKLETELKVIFGNNLRATGGSGMLTMQGYFESMEKRDGRRSLISL